MAKRSRKDRPTAPHLGNSLGQDMGGLVKMILERNKHAPALLFENIPNSRQDMQILCSQIDGIERLALAMGADPKAGITDFIQSWRCKVRNFQRVEPQYVKNAPTFENRVEKNIGAAPRPGDSAGTKRL